ncbi:MAG: hypothetical protein DBY36_01785 [Clostridiales bacterium]|nr:MAG: hypothetical protein DBY36_01785 [Clostridiales bacterium]
MNSIGYHFKEGVKGLFRNRLVNTAAIGMLIACLVVTGAFALVLLNINAVIDEAGAVNEISVYLDDACTEEARAAAEQRLSELASVESCTFVSKEEGLESMRDTFGSLLDGLEDDNPIRDMFRLTVTSQELLAQTAQAAEQVPGVAKVNFRNDVAQRFLQIRNVVAMIGIAFVVVLGLVSLFIISNSVRLSVYTRRTEIGVMKTVGATNGFIRTSFAFEGMLLGLIGAAAAYGLIALAYTKLFESALESIGFFAEIPIPFAEFAVPVAIAFGAAGLLMGFLGSALALRRYLNA